MSSPCLDQDLGFGKAVEDFAIEQFVAQAAVERFTIAILPRAAGGNLQCLHSDLRQPFLDGDGNKFGAIVGPYVCWRAVEDEQFSQDRQYIPVPDPACNKKGKALPARVRTY
jgi:hypothetical protein